MTQSMTAYAQASVTTELGELSCELRSVNHRYLEVAPRMPEELRLHEGAVRELIGEKLARGRVDVFIRLKESESSGLEPNHEAASNLNALLLQMRKTVPEMSAIRAVDVLRWPGVLQAKKVAPELMKSSLMAVLGEALEGMKHARGTEGRKMAALIHQRLAGIADVIEEVVEFLPEIAQGYRTRLDEKLADIKDQLDPSRLEQEMVIFLQKTDVAEELDRLKVHVEEVTAVLDKPEPAGRRLDFLMQELNREANTLGSKAHDPRLTKASVDLKVLIEQMREQVQNIE
ncbi:YicC/YloC family endoribonuclease [Arenicella sp. 4NH20-0111]|uniref:YicC/YloC family endoribonuclease n=1 Tax=Arenicella sp. 4NH20-0111 TaxID=3127648 RepID=UPI0033406899